MSLQDLGSLSDYTVNGDNYTKLEPDGSTLVIPGNTINGQPNRPVAPSRERTDAYYILGDPCVPSTLAASCAVWAHDATTGYWHVGPIADYNPEFTTCLCALVGDFEGLATDAACRQELESQINGLDGLPLSTIFPGWWLAANGFNASLPILIDKYLIACLPVFVIIPRASCPPPGKIQLINGVPVCMFDPPVPNHFPFALRSLRQEPRLQARRSLVPSPTQRALNPTNRPGIPRIMRPCGCESGPDFEESLSGN